jgi:DNA invertase Pin-like site-specific DNA recombinase
VGKIGSKRIGVVYCRVSTGTQKENNTIERQIETCRRIIERESGRDGGLELLAYGPERDGWLVDNGRSGSLLEGRRFAGLIDDLERRRIRLDVIVMPSLDRIAREDKSSAMQKQIQSAQDWGRIKAVLRAAHVIVIDEDGPNDPNTVMWDLKTALNGEEYRLIRSRMAGGQRRRLGEGTHAYAGKMKYGYRRVPRNGLDRKKGYDAEENTDESKPLRRILAWYADGGYVHAAQKANDAGISTPTAKYGKNKSVWDHRNVAELVKSARVYATGIDEKVIGGKVYRVHYPKLIDDKLYAAVQQRLKEHAIKNRDVYLSTGFVECAQCGSMVHVKKAPGRTYGYCYCPRRCGAVREERLSTVLWCATIFRLIEISRAKRAARASVDTYAEQIALAAAALQKVEDQISRLTDAYTLGIEPREGYIAKCEPLTSARAAAVGEVQRIEREKADRDAKRMSEETTEASAGKVVKQLAAAKDRILDYPLEKRRELLRRVLNGGRAKVTWTREHQATVELAAWGTLPPKRMRTEDCEPDETPISILRTDGGRDHVVI